MTDEEIDKMADDFVNAQEFTKVYGTARKAECGAFWKYGFLAGLKAGRPQWHDLEKEPTDLPKDNHNVWCKALDHYGEGWYDKDTNTWTLIYRGYHLHCIEAWCEIPTFDKE